MARYQVLFTLLPNGFAADGRARLSLVASPRPPAGRLGDSDVLHWPDIVAGWGTRALVLMSGGEPVEATVTSPRPDAALWAKLFNADTPVRKPTDDLSGLAPVVESAPYAEEVAFIDGLYAEALLAPEQAIGRVAGLNAWRGAGDGAGSVGSADVGDLLDPTRLTRDRLRAAASLLRGRRQGAAADTVALVPRLRRLALTSATKNNPYPGPPPVADGPLSLIAEPETADFA